jgi:hypothetical protein
MGDMMGVSGGDGFWGMEQKGVVDRKEGRGTGCWEIGEGVKTMPGTTRGIGMSMIERLLQELVGTG